MKVVVISDTHNRMSQVNIPPCDLVLHCGDLTMGGYIYEAKQFLEAFSKVKATYKVFIAGNHDFCFQEEKHRVEELLYDYPDIHYLENYSTVIEGLKIWGSPWQPWFHSWAFNFPQRPDLYEQRAKSLWGMIPEGTDIVLTHGPPYGVLDRVSRLEAGETDPSVGCKYLLDRILHVKPSLHCFGHIHEGYGTFNIPGCPTTFVNAATLDHTYKGLNPPHVFDIDPV